MMDLDQAIGKHAEWKTKFRVAISKKETLDETTISQDNCCELGKWLHGESKAKFSKFASHADCIRKHAAFHVEAGKVARMINEKKYTEAEAQLGANTAYSNASNVVGVAIIGLKKEVAKEIAS